MHDHVQVNVGATAVWLEFASREIRSQAGPVVEHAKQGNVLYKCGDMHDKRLGGLAEELGAIGE